MHKHSQYYASNYIETAHIEQIISGSRHFQYEWELMEILAGILA